MILTIPPSQREAFDAGEPVTVWVAFERQPDRMIYSALHGQHFGYRNGDPHPMDLQAIGPVGTRHAANITPAVDMGNGVSVSVGVLASCTVTDAGTVTQRDGAWGVEGMVVRA